MMVNLYQQLLCKFYNTPLYNIVTDGLVYNRRRFRRHRNYNRHNSSFEITAEGLIVFIAILLVGAWLFFSRYFSKTLRYIIAGIPAITAVVLFPFVISNFKIILLVAAGSIAGLFIYQHVTNSDPDYEGSFVMAALPDYLFTSGIITTAVEILFLLNS